MLPWETDPAMRKTEPGGVRRRLECDSEGRLQSHARRRSGQCPARRGSVAEEAAATLAATDKDVEIGGANMAAEAIALGLVDELRIFRNPVVVGGGTPFLPAVTENVPLDLVETRTFGSRVIYERYRRAHAESD